MYGREYVHQPHEISIETFAFCNARCTFCPYPTLARKNTRMSDELLAVLIEQMRAWEHPFFLSPFKVNEPFLDTRLESLCRTIVSELPKATIRLFTNGTVLTPDNIDWVASLPRGRVAHLWISLNESDPATYRKTMGLHFESVVKRLDQLHDVVAGGGFPHPVVISRVTDREQVQQPSPLDARFTHICKNRWPKFRIQIIKRDAWIDFTDATEKRVPVSPCARWWELNITADGKAALCCMDGEGDYAIGDVTREPLNQIYNQPHLVTRRSLMLARQGIKPCEQCTY